MDKLLFVNEDSVSHFLPAPQPGQNVWPKQFCPRYLPREAVMAGKLKECWYCRYADFHLGEAVALTVGICCFQKVQSW